MLVEVPVAPLLQSKVQPVQGLLIVSVCDWLEQILNGPAGVTTGVTGSGLTVRLTALLVEVVPQELVAVTV